jgi:hypothetical protein
VVHLKADDPDAVQRWQSISSFYADFAAMPHWGFLTPMVGLTAWIAQQPFAAPLFPGTAHEWLRVHLHTGRKSDLPFFSCAMRSDGRFEGELWASVGNSRGRWVVPLKQTRGLFVKLVDMLWQKPKSLQDGHIANPWSSCSSPRRPGRSTRV